MYDNPEDYIIYWKEDVDSTNDEMLRNASLMSDKCTLAAVRQHSGRGQGNHRWHSEEGRNLTFSILLKYGGDQRMKASRHLYLNYAASLAVTDFLAEYGIEACIKSPNDIMVNGRKICGMLIQNTVCGDNMVQSVAGFGINVNETEFPADLPDPISISMITGKTYDLKKCLRDFLRHFFHNFDAIWNEGEDLGKKYQEKLIPTSKKL